MAFIVYVSAFRRPCNVPEVRRPLFDYCGVFCVCYSRTRTSRSIFTLALRGVCETYNEEKEITLTLLSVCETYRIIPAALLSGTFLISSYVGPFWRRFTHNLSIKRHKVAFMLMLISYYLKWVKNEQLQRQKTHLGMCDTQPKYILY